MVSALSTDLYELTMATSYLRRGMRGPATYSLFVRKLPAHRGFLVCAGLTDALDFLASFRFTPEELDYVGATLGLAEPDLERLAGLRFTGDVWAIPEGTIVTAGEPLLEVTAPIAEAQLVETALLNYVSFQTTVASKAVRCRLAAPHVRLVDFSMRRTQSLQAAMHVARASYLAGFDATSNVAAGRAFGLPVTGTMAHSYVQAFASEGAAFRAFAEDFPEQPTFLVDTYDSLAGVHAAIEVIHGLGLDDRAAIRLDSGDLGRQALASRAALDAAGLYRVRIVASGSLDEYAVDALVRSGAPIDAYGIGTKIGVSADAPYLDTAYKLVAYDDHPMFKLSPGKATLPGRKQVFRAPGAADQVGLREQSAPQGTVPLLRPAMIAGRRVEADSLDAARRRCAEGLTDLGEHQRRLLHPVPLIAATTPELHDYAVAVGAVTHPAARTDGPLLTPGGAR